MEHAYKPGDYVRMVDPGPYAQEAPKGTVRIIVEVLDNGCLRLGNFTAVGTYAGIDPKRVEPVTVIDGEEVWMVSGEGFGCHLWPSKQLADEQAQILARDVPGKLFYVSRVTGVAHGAVAVRFERPTINTEISW